MIKMINIFMAIFIILVINGCVKKDATTNQHLDKLKNIPIKVNHTFKF